MFDHPCHHKFWPKHAFKKITKNSILWQIVKTVKRHSIFSSRTLVLRQNIDSFYRCLLISTKNKKIKIDKNLCDSFQVDNIHLNSIWCTLNRLNVFFEMGNLLRLMSHDSDGSCCGIPENVDVFVDFENAQVRLYIVIR